MVWFAASLARRPRGTISMRCVWVRGFRRSCVGGGGWQQWHGLRAQRWRDGAGKQRFPRSRDGTVELAAGGRVRSVRARGQVSPPRGVRGELACTAPPCCVDPCTPIRIAIMRFASSDSLLCAHVGEILCKPVGLRVGCPQVLVADYTPGMLKQQKNK